VEVFQIFFHLFTPLSPNRPPGKFCGNTAGFFKIYSGIFRRPFRRSLLPYFAAATGLNGVFPRFHRPYYYDDYHKE
jgi:hypothetical protein